MQGKRLIRKLNLKNFLSFGSGGEEIELESLNVLIGPNASGKSNLIEALGILQSTPANLAAAIRQGGGIQEWLWKGEQATPIAEIEAIVDYPEGIMPLRYRLCFTSVGQKLEIVDEVIENEHPSGPGENHVNFFYRYQDGHPILNVRTMVKAQPGTDKGREERYLQSGASIQKSIISQRIDVDNYPEITYLGDQFAEIWLYTDWDLGRNTSPRKPQKTDAPDDFLLEDASNLGLILNDLQHRSETWPVLLEEFGKFYDTAEAITTKVHAGTIQVFVHEKSLHQPIPATRLSDGTLRYLCLLTILCHPSPPPLVCIEEPELGLHPDILPTVAELLIEASQRTQLIITTHSDILVSALTEIPETVLVCEQDDFGTHLHRLEAEPLKKWLENYSLGELWRMGEIGGTRW
jgi:predicted ATPase